MKQAPEIFTLSNGIRVVHEYMPREAAHCGLMIAAGSRDEQQNEHGLAHFLEHCLFKGTSKRKTYQILSRLDSVGGELNAFTSKEETWIHATHQYQDYERAIELIADIAFHSVFPKHETDKEKDVIIDEINSYKDSPGDMIFEEFDAVLFGNQPLGRSILGTEKSIASFSSRDLKNFQSRIMNSRQLIFSSAGNIQTARLRQLLERYIGNHKLKSQAINRKKVYALKRKDIIEKREIHQVHFVTGRPAYSFDNKKRPGLALLNNLLGGPAMNNRLSMVIREKHGIAYHVDSNYAPFSDTGIFCIYLATDVQHFEKAQRLIRGELQKLCDQALTSRQLNEMRRQVIGQMILAHDSGSALMFNNAKSLQVFGEIDSLQEIVSKLNSITSDELHKIAIEIFQPQTFSSLTYVPA